MASILLVDDNESMRITLSILLKNAGHEVSVAVSGEEAIERLGQEGFDLVVTDLKMRSVGGLEVVKAARACSPPVEAVVITAHGSIEIAVQAMKIGAFDFLTKPFETEEFLLTVSRALERRSLLSEVTNLRRTVKRRYCLDNIVCESREMKNVLDIMERVSKNDITVLISGESGVGKEWVAKAIHNSSHRSDKPFVAINCGALPETLLESELFGHVKGAFTGAIANKTGLLEEASGGTIFLDEIGDMPLATQLRFLRVLQEKDIRRLGSNKSSRIDVRIISATHQDLQKLIKEGRFREDLFYRVNTVVLKIPPLKERKEDIVPLIKHFLELHCKKAGRPCPSISKEAMNILISYHWPGNVRELEHVIENTVVLSSGEVIDPSDLPVEVRKHSEMAAEPPEGGSLMEVEKEHIIKALRKHSWNKAKAAKEMGIGRNTLWRKLKDFNIEE